MKKVDEIIEPLKAAKPDLDRRFSVRRLAVFGSYARGDQREDSDVDILVEVDPSIGWRFVDLAEEIKPCSVSEPNWSPAGRLNRGIGTSLKRNSLMSHRLIHLLIANILEIIEKIERYLGGWTMTPSLVMRRP